MRKNRPRQRFVDCAIERLVQSLLATLSQILTNTVEDDDRVVERITDNGKNRRDDRERNLEVHQLEERQRREHVVSRRDERRKREAPLEADCQIHSRDKEREQHRDDCVACELVADARANGLGANDVILVRAKFLRQNGLDAILGCLSTSRRCALLFRFLRANRELAIVSELLNLSAVNSRLIEMRAKLTNVDRLIERNLHHRSTSELDALVDSAENERAHADGDENRSQPDCNSPRLDEIDIGVVKNSKHQMLRVCVFWLRLSQIM